MFLQCYNFQSTKVTLKAIAIEYNEDESCVILAVGDRTKSKATKAALIHYNSSGVINRIQALDNEQKEKFEEAAARLIV